MDVTLFIYIVAVIFAVLSGLFTVLRIIGWYMYNHTTAGSIDKARDIITRGGTATFPIFIPGAVFIVCIAAIFSMNG